MPSPSPCVLATGSVEDGDKAMSLDSTILGDATYGRSDSEKRQMLHSYKLEFNHPASNEKMMIFGELPQDFKKALKKCGFEDFEKIIEG
mgnify:CR=1 FL=1